MKTARATIHMALACYLSDSPDTQVKLMAERVARRTHSKRTKRTMQHIINAAKPAELVKRVYADCFRG